MTHRETITAEDIATCETCAWIAEMAARYAPATTIRLEETPADSEVVQAADMIAFYAAHPSAAGDPADLEGFRL